MAGCAARPAEHGDGRGPGLVRGDAARRRPDRTRPATRLRCWGDSRCSPSARGAVDRCRARRVQCGSGGAAAAANRRAVALAACRPVAASHSPQRRTHRDRRGSHRGVGRAVLPLAASRDHWRSAARCWWLSPRCWPIRWARWCWFCAACWFRSRWPRRVSVRRPPRAASSSRWRGCRRGSSTACAASPPSSCTARRSAEANSLAAAADELRRRTMRVLRVAFLSSAALDLAAALAFVVLALHYGVLLASR